LPESDLQIAVGDSPDRDSGGLTRCAASDGVGRHDTSYLIGAVRRCSPGARLGHSTSRRVGQSLTWLRVMVESGAYCGMALRGRSAISGAPCAGSPNRVEKSSTVTGRVSPSNASITSPSHERPVQRSVPFFGSPVEGIGTAWPGRP